MADHRLHRVSDLYELTIAVDLRDEISETELAELSWHLGIGPQPERLSIVTRFPVVVEDDDGIPVIEDDPHPLLAERGAALRVGGALCSVLAGRADLSRKGWSLTSRQEIHPDQFEEVGELLCWLAARAHATHLRGDGAIGIGFLRFIEAEVPDVLQVENGQVGWPT
ncbi:hypothetical protein [Streptomyces sp. NBC_01294]|uniref:hypothetical protein n=1 Tax=Streptomyces sp. NBC_01294 TaxID=2903815 RepID=UPI002DDB8372|nr:hypothetical protein [Streptomyces sp. NBC_01294]WRZ61863.1 hypothetical protein OG534_16365 [Streptomyces sp. NBC_01294]